MVDKRRNGYNRSNIWDRKEAEGLNFKTDDEDDGSSSSGDGGGGGGGGAGIQLIQNYFKFQLEGIDVPLRKLWNRET